MTPPFPSRRPSYLLEGRTDGRPGGGHGVCSALAGLRISVRSAHVDTLGPQAMDVFYLQEPGAGALSDERSAEAAHAVRRRLTPQEQAGSCRSEERRVGTEGVRQCRTRWWRDH